MIKCLVIGGNGFIGQNIVTELQKRSYKINVLDLDDNNISKSDNIHFYKGTIENNKLIESAMKGVDIVYYYISTTNVITSVSNFDENIKNLSYLKKCVDSMISNNVKKIVFASSGGTVYGEPKYFPINEDHPKNPISPYGIIKFAMEKYLLYYQKQFGIEPLILRYSNPFGHYNSTRMVGAIDIFYNKILNDELIEIYGNPNNIIRDYIDISSLVDITIQLSFFNSTNYSVYNVGSGLSVSLNDIITYFERLLNKKAKVELKEKKNENVSKIVLDIARIEKELKVKDIENIDDLLRDKYSHFLRTEYAK